MIWTNTDYMNHLIRAAVGMLEHYGKEDAPGLASAIEQAQDARDAWGDILWQNPDVAAKHPGNDVQDLLNYIAQPHAAFDEAMRDLERSMRLLSCR